MMKIYVITTVAILLLIFWTSQTDYFNEIKKFAILQNLNSIQPYEKVLIRPKIKVDLQLKISNKTKEIKFNTMKPEKRCLVEGWLTSQANGQLGNSLCMYAHIKGLQLRYDAQVSIILFYKVFIMQE